MDDQVHDEITSHQEWFVDFEIFFIFEIATDKIRHLLPSGVHPIEVRPGVSLFSCLVVNFKNGSCGFLPPLTEVMFNINVQPDLSIDMLLPKFCFYLVGFISSEQAGREHSAGVNKMPVHECRGLRVDLDRQNLSVRVADDDGLIFALRVTDPEPRFEKRFVSTQFTSSVGDDVYLGKLYWGLGDLMEQQRHLDDCSELNGSHPFFHGADVTGAECYMQMCTPSTVDSREKLYPPRLIRSGDQVFTPWPRRDRGETKAPAGSSPGAASREEGAPGSDSRRETAEGRAALRVSPGADRKPRIAIVGSGISGLGAAWVLHPHAEITVFEKDDRWGGHSFSMPVQTATREVAIDIGVVAIIPMLMPTICALLARPEYAGIDVLAVPFSLFSVWTDKDGASHCWSNDPGHRRIPEVAQTWTRDLQREATRFMMHMAQFPEADPLETYETWLPRHGYSELFRKCVFAAVRTLLSIVRREHERVPLIADFITIGNTTMSYFNQTPFFRFDPCVQAVLDILTRGFVDRIRTEQEVVGLWPEGEGVALEVRPSGGPAEKQTFDSVIFTGNLAVAPKLLNNSRNPHFTAQDEVLSLYRSEPAWVYIHRDYERIPAIVPPGTVEVYEHDETSGMAPFVHYDGAAVLDYPEKPIWVTYYEERLDPEPAHLMAEPVLMTHTYQDLDSLIAKTLMHSIQGVGGVWYAGACTTNTSMEHAFLSGLEIARRICPAARYPFDGGTIVEANARKNHEFTVDTLMFPHF